ncbi:hypothetical protein TNIN_216571 [Trichonephila inaurata madagascariensis]|uniref:Uncharacterized protein n=1 Tax=Trichonephila inaurata madagascariensis TaxID=2747483 RepID=A0A8X6XRY5_9ARAC|nr:hypothetical protein TNIN_216571 [Trichonephila inaurata madagascariensis]
MKRKNYFWNINNIKFSNSKNQKPIEEEKDEISFVFHDVLRMVEDFCRKSVDLLMQTQTRILLDTTTLKCNNVPRVIPVGDSMLLSPFNSNLTAGLPLHCYY